tara:strand:+ start:1393 stop:2073 length:681 start_codon:yes stop_codon:yes gene_type:complete
MTKETITILNLSKGRMKAESEKVFRKSKLKIIQKSERSLIGYIKGYPNIRVLYMNATEIIEALGKGIGDIGISGKDLWRESEQSIQSNIALAKEYNWGKSDLVVAVDNMWLDCVNPTDLEDISYEFYQKKKRLMRCATKFKNLAHAWFNSKGITQYELITSLGATEVANKLTADLIVDLSSSGETLRQNNLKVIDTILSSSACLFYSKKSIKKKGVKKIIKLLSKD